MTIRDAQKWSKAWLRLMNIYAYALTDATNAANTEDMTYYGTRYVRAHARWCNAIGRVGDMNVAAAQAAVLRR